MTLKSKLEFDALGTHWWIELPAERSSAEVGRQVRERVTQFESNYSRFLPSSLIGTLNIDKTLSNPSAELLAMLQFARDMYDESDGTFNISVGGTLTNLGYGRGGVADVSWSLWDDIVMNDDIITIPSNVMLDFGGFGKGWLIDDIGSLLQSNGFNEFIVNGGGDILVSSDQPIEFTLEHPTNQSQKIGTTRISHGALAVSSVSKRSWKASGVVHHHIIDPRLGASSSSSTVATYIRAESALIADTMATILLIAPELEAKLRDKYALQVILLGE